MKRVASLWLPEWALDRLRRAGRVPRSEAEPARRNFRPSCATFESRPADGGAIGRLGSVAAAERAKTCSVPNTPDGRPRALWARDDAYAADLSRTHQGSNNGWRPGAKWARADMEGNAPATRAEVEAAVAGLPAHQRPSMREMGRRSEPAGHPFKAMPPDEAGTSQLALWAAMPAVRYPGEGPRPPADENAPFPGEGRFFLTGRMTGSVVARACPETADQLPLPPADNGVPVVTAEAVEGRMEVAAASPAARALGAAPGVALTQARATIPGLVILPADPEGDRAALRRLAIALARRWAPVVTVSGEERGGAAGLFLDLTGVSHLYGAKGEGEAAFCRRLSRLLDRLGYCNHIAIADTPGAAWAFARHLRQHPHAICPAAAHVEALEPLSVAALRLEARHVELLRRLGVDTVEELMRLPRAPLARRFGGALVRRLDQATGRAPEPLKPVIPPEHIAVRQHFVEPIGSAEAIEHWLGRLAPRLCEALAKAGRGARSVELVAERVDGVPQIVRVGLARPVRDPDHLLRLLRRRIEEIAPGFGLDALALHVRRSDPLGSAPLASELAEEAAPDLALLTDLIANRLGSRAPWRVEPVESEVPERSVTPIPALDLARRPDPKLREDDVRRLATAEDDHPWHPRWPRPVRLLPRPEPIEHVLAELPDHPPRRFTWRGRSYKVVRADGPERITGEWWRRGSERDAVRDYFHLEDEAGRRFWLFRRGDGVRTETGDLSWHLHGAFG